jgi:hypothetical protein
VATAQLFDGCSGLRFLQDGNDLFFGVSSSLHGSDRYASFDDVLPKNWTREI